ncbi:MAG TPA: restriction endonuclease subunit S [Clostridiales bacterium]|nr:restriction endonuclease subunit S [Clostridiales bacterium]
MKTTIGTHCTVTSSKRFRLSERAESGVPFFCSKQIIQLENGEIPSDYDHITNEHFRDIQIKYGVPSAGDLLITTRGTYGIPYIYKERDCFYFADGNLTWLKDFDDCLSSHYLYYWFKSYEGQKKIDAIAKGTAQKAVPIALIKDLQLSLPPISQQKRIASILSAYDDLIENNRRQIKLLEEAAQRLYREWFVELRFPGHEGVKVVDGVPEGWKKGTFDDICTVKKDALTPDKISPGMPYIGLEHIPRNDFCLADWGMSEEVNSNKFRFNAGDILFGKIRPYFHKVGFTICNGICSTDSIVMNANDEYYCLLLMTASSDEFVDYTYQTCKEGAKMPRADWNTMKMYPVLIPDSVLLRRFNKQISAIKDKCTVLALQNRQLTEARDRLLPKLMSGEMEV